MEKKALEKIFKEKALEKVSMELSPGLEVDHYFNMKAVTLSPEGLFLCGKILYKAVRKWDGEAVAGIIPSGVPLVSAIALEGYKRGRELPALLVRRETKESTDDWIEDPRGISPGTKVVLVEDIIATGQSTLKALEKLFFKNYKVEHVVCLVDRELGAEELLASQNITLKAVFKSRELLGSQEEQDEMS